MNVNYLNVGELFEGCSIPPTPEQFTEIMKTIIHKNEVLNDDTEASHAELDKAMCILLEMLGFNDGVKVFTNATRYYA